MLRFGETKAVKEEFCGVKICDVNIDNIVISKLIEAMNISKHLIESLVEVIKRLSLILPKMIGYVKTFIEKNNELISMHMHDEKQLDTYKTIWAKIGNFTC